MQFDASLFLPAVEARLASLPQGLLGHIERARVIGRDLCQALEVDRGRVDLALAAHDVFRAAPDQELLAEASRRGWEADPVEQAEPMLLHGPVASLWLLQEAGVDDPDVIDAVTWHTTFAAGLGLVPAIVFIADKVDPDKVRRQPWLTEVRDIACRGKLEEAVELYLARTLVQILERGGVAHPRALDALNAVRLGAAGRS